MAAEERLKRDAESEADGNVIEDAEVLGGVPLVFASFSFLMLHQHPFFFYSWFIPTIFTYR